MVRKYEDATNWTFYISRAILEKAKAKSSRLGVSLSAVVNDFLEKWVESEEDDLEHKYAGLQRQFRNLLRLEENLTKQLKKLGAYDEMIDTVERLGLDVENLSNMNEIVAELHETYDGPSLNLRLFIQLLETMKKRIEIGKQLENIEKRKYSAQTISFQQTTLQKAAKKEFP